MKLILVLPSGPAVNHQGYKRRREDVTMLIFNL